MKQFFNSIKANKKFNNLYQIFYLVILLSLIIYFWDHTVLYPFKLLVVFFHETSHALATIFTGGEVKDFVVIQQQGGYVVSDGGNRFIILNSGYLGSLAWGLVIYVFAVMNKFNKVLMVALGIIIGIITIMFVSNLFALVFGLVITAVMILIGIYVPVKINNFILRLIGLTSMVYVPLDILSDTIYRSHLKSDAQMLADEFGGATIIWGSVWLFLSIFLLFLCLRWTLKRGFARNKTFEQT
jgi:hypothetical protein